MTSAFFVELLSDSYVSTLCIYLAHSSARPTAFPGSARSRTRMETSTCYVRSDLADVAKIYELPTTKA